MSMIRTLIGNVKGPKGDTGDTGATGATGANGAAATINVGTVTTSAYGTTAQVTNSGTELAAVFDFVIPQGKPGEETTRMSGLTLDQITAQSATYPIPAVGESGATIWGKVVKFFNDCKTALASKVNVSDIVNNLTSTVADKPLSAAQGKALNDALTPLYRYYMTNCNAISARGSINNGGVKKIGSAVVVNLIFKAVTTVSNSPQIATSPYKPRYDSALSCIDITNGIGSAIESDIPCGIASNGNIYVKTLTTNHIYALTGVFITADNEI